MAHVPLGAATSGLAAPGSRMSWAKQSSHRTRSVDQIRGTVEGVIGDMQGGYRAKDMVRS